MKRALAVLCSAALLALILTACGTGKDNTTGSSASNGDYNTDSAAPGDAVLGDTTPDAIPDNGTTDNKTPSTDEGSMTSDLEKDAKDAADDLENGVKDAANDVKDAVDGAARSTEPKEDESLFRAASYEQMVRNARVHDTDGILTDGENSLTPGVAH